MPSRVPYLIPIKAVGDVRHGAIGASRHVTRVMTHVTRHVTRHSRHAPQMRLVAPYAPRACLNYIFDLVHVEVNEVPILRLNFVRRSGIQNFAKLRPVPTRSAAPIGRQPCRSRSCPRRSARRAETRERPRHPSHARRGDG